MRHFALNPRVLKSHPRRRFLALSLPLAAAALSPLLPWPTGPLARLAQTLAGGWPAATAAPEREVDFSQPFYLRESPSAVRWLIEHIQTQVAAKDRARVLAAAMTEDALYPFFWVIPGRLPDFATVFAYLKTGAIPEHRRGLKRWQCGIYPDRDETTAPLWPSADV
jgi:hypothetical protein